MPLQLKPNPVIIADLGLEPNGEVHAFFTNECYKAMDKYVPYDNGDLRSNVDVQTDKIIYESPYAKYQYYGKKMVMSNGKSAFYNPDYGFWSKKGEKKTLTDEDLVYHTPGTGSYWDEKMWTAEGEDVVRRTQNYFDKHGGK